MAIEGEQTITSTKKLGAEFIGPFWLVLGSEEKARLRDQAASEGEALCSRSSTGCLRKASNEMQEKEMSNISEITDFLENLGEAILIVNDASEIIFVNSACASLFCYQKDQMLQLRVDDLMNKLQSPNHKKLVKKYVGSNSSAKEMMARTSMLCVNSKGEEFSARISIASVKIDEKIYGVATVQDYTSIQEKISALESSSNVDMLTSLFNRRYLHEVLKTRSRVLSAWDTIGVLYLDLNKFKSVNDKLGHKMGDSILKVVANRLKESVRFDDILFRVGGDEFLMLINLTGVSEKLEMIQNISNKICEQISEPISVQNHFINVGISIGAGIYPDDKNELNELIHHADKAMYLSKESATTVAFVNQLPNEENL